jgi:release factor glutamine methyltransferase
MMTADRARRLRQWHRDADRELRQGLPRRMLYLGLDLLIPEQVFTPSTDAFHPLVRDQVRQSDQVLDMGTGCGIDAILAAQRGATVLGVDINPRAVAAAQANAVRNRVTDHVRFHVSDVFDAVPEAFDLILFHPPFRWFRARDLLELSTTDENYGALTRFMNELRQHLRPNGRVLIRFASSGDIDYLRQLIDQTGLSSEVLACDEVAVDHLTFTYYVFRLTR